MSIHLSRRLETICSLVTTGSTVVDVGCDHAHVPIRLLQDNICKKAYGFDVADGPLEIAKTNVELAGLSDRCEIRKSDGLEKYRKGEADTLIIAGMGGMLIRSLLEKNLDKAEDFRELILGPHREPWQVREFLYQEGFGIFEERLVEEEGKYYPIIKVAPGRDTVRPDWDDLMKCLAGMELAGQDAANRDQVLQLLPDRNFRLYAETTFGPVLLDRYFSGKEETMDSFLLQLLSRKLSVYQSLAEKEEKSAASESRRNELRGEIGMLQTLVFLHHSLLKITH